MAAVLAAIAAPLPALADEDAKRLLETIYKTYAGKAADGLDFHGEAKAKRYFSPDTVRLLARDRKEAKGEVGRLDFDPFINGQDWEVTTVAVAVEATGADTARGTVRLTNIGKPQVVTHDLARTPNGWRIHDIRWPGTKATLRSILSRPSI